MLPLLKIKFHRTMMSIFNTTLFKLKAIKLLSLIDIFLNFNLIIMYHWLCHGTRVLLPNSNFLGCFCFQVHIHSCDQGWVLLCHLHWHTLTEEEGDRKYDYRLRFLDWIICLMDVSITMPKGENQFPMHTIKKLWNVQICFCFDVVGVLFVK